MHQPQKPIKENHAERGANNQEQRLLEDLSALVATKNIPQFRETVCVSNQIPANFCGSLNP